MFDFYGANILMGILKVILVLLPIPLTYFTYRLWFEYVSGLFVSGIQWQLLELQIPQQVLKTPLAMETIISNSMYHKSNKGLWDKYWMGAVPLYFSLEIVSLEGNIHFYINTPSRVASLIKSQVYAQYPQAKVLEVDDYVYSVPRINKKTGWSMWGCEWKLEHSDALPLRTYVDYGLDKTVEDPSIQVDPIISLIEFMSTLGPGEHIWTQLIIKWSEKEFGSGLDKRNFLAESQEVLNELVKPYSKITVDADSGNQTAEVRPPSFLDDKIKGIVNKQHKLAFDCGLRTIYVAKNEVFDQQKKKALRTIYRQYESPSFNSLSRVNGTGFNSPWQDPFEITLDVRKNRMLDFYRQRTLFNPPWQYGFKYPFPINLLIYTDPPETFVLNTEEIATLFHFPATISSTPSLKRVETRSSKAPTNLPI